MKHSDEQRMVIECRAPKVAAVAGPGSGKTATLVSRLAAILPTASQGVVVITFTTAAAGEIRRRLKEREVDMAKLIYVGTIHGMALKVVRTNFHAAGYRHAPSVIGESTLVEWVKGVCDEKWLGGRVTPPSVVSELRKNHSLRKTPRQRLDTAAIASMRVWERLKKACMVPLCGLVETAELVLNQFGGMPCDELLVDEAQDCSETDMVFFEAVRAKRLFMVGDTDQAIYSFRGGDPAVFRAFAEAADRVGGLHLMQTNYRCRPEICEAAQNTISRDPRRVQKRTISIHAPSAGEVVRRLNFDEQGQEIDAIRAWYDSSKAKGESHAVLVRTNFEVGLIEKTIGIPTRKVTQAGFRPAGWEIAVVACALCDAIDNEDLAATYVEIAFGKKAPEVIARCRATGAAGESLGRQLLAVRGRQPRTIDELLSLVPVGGGVSRLVNRIVDSLPSDITFGELSGELAAYQGETEVSGPEGALWLMTMHKSKGLEFDHVWLPGWGEGIFPRESAIEEDERRLAYVAMTRAAKSLTISWAKEGFYSMYGAMKADNPGKFVRQSRHSTIEIPD